MKWTIILLVGTISICYVFAQPKPNAPTKTDSAGSTSPTQTPDRIVTIQNERELDWFTPAIALLGVIVGSLLTPYVSARIEQVKEKRVLKPELIKTIYIFFNYRKASANLSNRSSMLSVGARLAADEWRNINYPQERRDLGKEQYDALNKAMEENRPELSNHFSRLVDCESTMHSILEQIAVFYNNALYEKLSEIIHPIIDASNEPVAFYDYHNMNYEVYTRTKALLPNRGRENDNQLNHQCSEIIKKVQQEFK